MSYLRLFSPSVRRTQGNMNLHVHNNLSIEGDCHDRANAVL